MDCTIYVAKTKALISFAVTAKLIWVFVFAYAKSRFSHDTAHMHPSSDAQSHETCKFHVKMDFDQRSDIMSRWMAAI